MTHGKASQRLALAGCRIGRRSALLGLQIFFAETDGIRQHGSHHQ